MSFRRKLLTVFALTVFLSVGAVTWIVSTVTRRAFERSRIETAARRPRPNRERLRPWLERKLLPTCPAFFAARITSPTKVWGRLPPRLPC